MAITRQKKEEVLSELIDKFSKAKSVAFGQYAGMSVSELSDMRSAMREANVEFKVAKRTLLKLAAKESGLELPDDIMEGTVGAAFSYDDVVSGPKILKKTSKTVKVVKLMGGVMDGKVISITQMGELASLPSKEELLAKFVGMMRAPLYGFHAAVSSPLSGFARALSAYSEQMPTEESAAEAPKEEAPKEEDPKEEAPKEEPEKEEAAEDTSTEVETTEDAPETEESTDESSSDESDEGAES